MADLKTIIDHDRNIRFDHPADWTTEVEPAVEGRTGFITVWSPANPAGGPGVLVVIAMEWHQEQDLASFVDRRLHRDASSPGFDLRARSQGRHPITKLPATTVSYDVKVNDKTQRKEMIFVEASLGLVMSATSICPSVDRNLWRPGCKVIFGTLGMADPHRPPVPAEGVLGLGLQPGQPAAIERLWMLLDVVAKRLVDSNRELLAANAGPSLGASAHFEARTFLLYELLVAMTLHAHPPAGRLKIMQVLTHAITGRWPVEPPPPEGPLARLRERHDVYKLADAGKTVPVSKERLGLFADLLTTAGTEHTPQQIVPRRVYDRVGSGSSPKSIVYSSTVSITMPFRFSIHNLFGHTPDVTGLSLEEVDERFEAGHAEAAEMYKK